MFYTTLISSHYCSNAGNDKKFISIDICSSLFMIILGVPVIGDSHGIQRANIIS